ncbi:MAG TPA: DNA polymerase III subunit gamma/tau [Trueperaceae bacterium]
MTALYQRARPYTFDQVVGQEHVKDVLASAVARGLTGHAYLFSGPRGVGKTTTARLMAMAVNCEREDPADRPCGECESCRLVRDGAHPDVIELDAASNNSVDDVRALRERVGLASLRGGTRVWILDEAHMLSRPAANALLKTLEEPPPGLMFVLATTEPEKLPPTILSRCQHFRFRRLTDAEILGKLARLCSEAGVEAEEAALALVARAADGAMRDAESLLERLLVGGGPITASAAEDALGLPPRERLVALAEALIGGDLAALLPQAGDLYRAGFAPRTVAEQLGRTLRDLLHEALGRGDDASRLVALIHALDEEQDRFTRRDDLYGLEVALIKAAGAGASAQGARGAASEEPVVADAPPSRPSAAEAPPPGPAGDAPGAPDAEAAPDRAPAGAEGAGGAGRRQFSWHAVRSAAAPQLKALLQPAQAAEEGGRVTVTFGENWRFHYEQVLARRAELEELIARVAGPGLTVELKGPRGSGSGGRRRLAAGADDAPATGPRSAGGARTGGAPGPAARGGDAASGREAAAPTPDLPDAAPGEEPDDEAGTDDAAPAEAEAPSAVDEAYEELPAGFWDESPAEPLGEAAEETPAGSAPGSSLAQLQQLFPGRVIEFRPRAPRGESALGDAAPDASEDEPQGYDDEGQDRLEFGAAPDDR